jgi:8-oxo-dGTP pyrophosphatase MutT (NUDIX family)
MRPTPADPDAWNAYLAEGNATQARKRVAADLLIRDTSGRVLLVDPTYKPGWDLPGGMAEANEPPHAAALREAREELGLTISLRSLLVVDWVAPHGPWDDQIAFIFDAGTLDDTTASTLYPHDGELSDIRFVPLDEAPTMLRERLANRFLAAVRALEEGSTAYLHDGHAVLPAPLVE